MRLYDVTQEPRYLALVKYFIEERGAQPHFYDIEYEKRGKTSHWNTYGPAWMVKDKAYSQAHQPLAEQQTAIGHAVRFVYLMAGMAHLARLSHDEGKRRIVCGCGKTWPSVSSTLPVGSARRAAAKPSAVITICPMTRCMPKAAPRLA
jgi:DUF1680 family protein